MDGIVCAVTAWRLFTGAFWPDWIICALMCVMAHFLILRFFAEATLRKCVVVKSCRHKKYLVFVTAHFYDLYVKKN